MIYGNIAQLEAYGFLDPPVLQALQYAAAHDLHNLEKGRHEVCGSDDLYFNAAQYTTAPAQEKQYEAHRAYIDVHYVIEGAEAVDIAFVEDMQQGVYDAQADYLPVAGKATARVVLRPGDFLVCYPQDGHCPGIQVDAPQPLQKVIFKVRVGAAAHAEPAVQ
jgi:YhcH/YjgK/YiaL family protein